MWCSQYFSEGASCGGRSGSPGQVAAQAVGTGFGPLALGGQLGRHRCLNTLPVCSRPQSGQTLEREPRVPALGVRCRAPGSAGVEGAAGAAGSEDRPHGTDAPLPRARFSFAGENRPPGHSPGGAASLSGPGVAPAQPQPVRMATGPWPVSLEDSCKQLAFLNPALRQMSSKSQLPRTDGHGLGDADVVSAACRPRWHGCPSRPLAPRPPSGATWLTVQLWSQRFSAPVPGTRSCFPLGSGTSCSVSATSQAPQRGGAVFCREQAGHSASGLPATPGPQGPGSRRLSVPGRMSVAGTRITVSTFPSGLKSVRLACAV